ncbi:MAG TPA: IniB N-terminal domain-containing protein, partial [Mycobacterium sp.]|nr:IniB N-terminal domain-containing protein [Mycobacterium sp.]
MDTVLQFILDLFRDENAAQAFVADPNAALADAGLADVIPQQLQSVAATAVPGLELAPANPIAGLQQAVSNQFGFAPVESVLPEVGAGIVTDQAAQIGLDGGSAIAAALGEGLGAGLGAGLEGGAE